MIAVSCGLTAAELGFITLMTYSVTPLTMMPLSKPPSVMVLTGMLPGAEGVAHGFIVNIIAPLPICSAAPAPTPPPSTLKAPEVSVLLWRMSELIAGLPATERVPDGRALESSSRTLEPPPEAASVVYSVVMSRTRSEIAFAS